MLKTVQNLSTLLQKQRCCKQAVSSAVTMVCRLKYTLTTWDFLLVEKKYQPLFTGFEPSNDLMQWGWY